MRFCSSIFSLGQSSHLALLAEFLTHERENQPQLIGPLRFSLFLLPALLMSSPWNVPSVDRWSPHQAHPVNCNQIRLPVRLTLKFSISLFPPSHPGSSSFTRLFQASAKIWSPLFVLSLIDARLLPNQSKPFKQWNCFVYLPSTAKFKTIDLRLWKYDTARYFRQKCQEGVKPYNLNTLPQHYFPPVMSSPEPW